MVKKKIYNSNTNGANRFSKIESICIHPVIKILQFIINPYRPFRGVSISFLVYFVILRDFNITLNEKGMELFQ